MSPQAAVIGHLTLVALLNYSSFIYPAAVIRRQPALKPCSNSSAEQHSKESSVVGIGILIVGNGVGAYL